ncbi:MAG: hypothetical protein U0414_20460 [Polyangiaceae bacterium]
MPDLQLDPHSAQLFSEVLDQRRVRGFTLSEGCKLTLDPLHSAPESSLLQDLKAKLPFIDFEAGGLKLYETHYRGSTIKFTAKPGWEFDARGGSKGLGQPTMTLQFSVHF